MDDLIPRKRFYCPVCLFQQVRYWPENAQKICHACHSQMLALPSPDGPSFIANPLAARTAAQLSPDEPLILGRKVLIEKRSH